MDHEVVLLSSSPNTLEQASGRLYATAYDAHRTSATFAALAMAAHGSAPETFATQRKTIPSGSRASTIPADAVTGFQAASLLPRAADTPSKDEPKPKPKKRVTETSLKRRKPPTNDSPSAEKETNDVTDGKETKTEVTVNENMSRRKRKRINEDSSTRPQMGSEARATAGAPQMVTEPPNDGQNTALQVQQITSPDARRNVLQNTRAVIVDLAEATSPPAVRKRSWTPPLPKSAQAVAEGVEHHSSTPSAQPLALDTFQYVQSSPKRSGIAVDSTAAKASKPVPVLTHKSLAAIKPSPKKRLPTITEHSLTRFERKETARDQCGEQAATTLANDVQAVLKATASRSEKSSKKHRKAKSGKAPKAKTTETVRQIVVSPRSVRGRLAAQGMMFGTSSQLAVTDARATLSRFGLSTIESARTIMATTEEVSKRFRFASVSGAKKPSIWDSEFTSSAQQFWQDEEATESAHLLLHGKSNNDANVELVDERVRLPEADKDDLDASKDFQDIDDIPLAELRQHRQDKFHSRELLLFNAMEEEWKDIDDLSLNKDAEVNKVSTAPAAPQIGTYIGTERGADTDEFAIPAAETIKHVLKAAEKKRSRGRPKTSASENPSKPKQRASLKAVKTTKVASSKSPAKKRAKKIKTPRKKTKDTIASADNSFVAIDDILDDEAAVTPSPPRLTTAVSKELPLTTSPVPKARRAGFRPDWEDVKSELFKHISSFVLSCPASNDLSNLSFHEQILMYQPILLEDFTAWLNDGGLRVKGIKKGDPEQELAPWMVARWCDDKSVCFMWKLTNRNVLRSTK